MAFRFLSGLRSRQASARLVAIGIATALWIGGVWSQQSQTIVQLEYRLSDRFAAWVTPVAGRSDAVTVVSLTQESERSAQFNRLALAKIIREIASRAPSAIGLALPTLQPTTPATDAAFRSVLFDAGIPVVVMWTGEEDSPLLDAIDAAETIVSPGADGAIRSLYAPDPVAGALGFEPRLAGIEQSNARALEGPIRYRRGSPSGRGAFDVVMSDLIATAPDALFRDRIVIVGRSDDLRPAPADLGWANDHGPPAAPVAVISAHVVDMLIRQDFIGNPHSVIRILISAATLIAVMAAALAGAVAGARQRPGAFAFAVTAMIVLILGGLVPAYFRIDGPPTATMGVAALLAFLIGLERATAARAASAEASLRLLAPHPSESEAQALKPHRREISVLSISLDEFAAVSESQTPERTVELAGAFADLVDRASRDHGGSHLVRRPDGCQVAFGLAPRSPEHAVKAIDCAAQILSSASLARADPQSRMLRCVATTGEMIAGQFPTIGLHVAGQAAQHSEALLAVARRIGVSLLVTQDTLDSVQSADLATDPLAALSGRPIGDVRLGKTAKPAPIFEIVLGERQHPEALSRYRAAFDAMAAENAAAIDMFRAILEATPEDPLAALHLNRLHRGEKGVEIVFD